MVSKLQPVITQTNTRHDQERQKVMTIIDTTAHTHLNWKDCGVEVHTIQMRNITIKKILEKTNKKN